MESLAAALRDAKAVYKNETQLTKDLRRAASNRHSGGSRRHSGPLGWPAPAATAQQSCFECHQVRGARRAGPYVWCLPAKRTTFAWRSRTAGLPTSHRLLDQIFAVRARGRCRYCGCPVAQDPARVDQITCRARSCPSAWGRSQRALRQGRKPCSLCACLAAIRLVALWYTVDLGIFSFAGERINRSPGNGPLAQPYIVA